MNQNEIIKMNNNLILKKSHSNDILDLSKSELNKRYDANLKQIVNSFRNVPSFIEALKSINKDDLYKIIIPEEVSEKLKDGSAKWNFDKTGLQLPTISNQDGSIICQVRLEEIKPDYFSNLNNIALQSTLADILNQLEELNEQVLNVLQGQHSDRIGIIKGAEETYKQALLIKDSDTRKHLLTQAITKLNIGRSQLIESLDNKTKFIDKLPKSPFQITYKSLFKIFNSEKVERNFLELQSIFENIISSTSYIALAYEELGELHSLEESLNPLRNCIRDYSYKMNIVKDYIPYNPKFEYENAWYKNPEKTIERFDSHFTARNTKKNKYIEIQVSGEQLL